MLHASYRSDVHLYEVVQANLDNIVDDMAYALQDSVDIDLEEYRSRMEMSVGQGLAYRVLKDGIRIGVMYNLFEDGEYQGACLYCKNDRVGMMVLLKTVFEVHPWHKIKIMPHSVEDVKYYVSMATTASIKEYYARSTPLTIVKADVVVRVPELFKYLDIEVV